MKAKKAASKAGGMLGPVGGLLAVLVPKGICPLCLSTSGSVLPALGLSFLADSSIMRWVLAALLLLSLSTFFISARNKERWHVFAIATAGAVLVYVGWLVTSPVTLYGGTGVMLTASILNLKKPRDESQLPLSTTEGITP
ncbi:MAG: MerC domain-containing protein [Deltaproteobacteria bacterium]|nr:MerC domain-containing protein [Deltaproteobacteria bacterium]